MGYCPHCGEEVDARDLRARDNTFREDPEPNQTSLDELSGVESSEGSDGDNVWDGIEVDRDRLEITEPALEPGEVWNQNDPAKW